MASYWVFKWRPGLNSQPVVVNVFVYLCVIHIPIDLIYISVILYIVCMIYSEVKLWKINIQREKGNSNNNIYIYRERERERERENKLWKNIISKTSTFFKKQTFTPPLWTVFPLRTYLRLCIFLLSFKFQPWICLSQSQDIIRYNHNKVKSAVSGMAFDCSWLVTLAQR